MMEQAAFMLLGRNPDVLTCIANLSNDEVFTPPAFANRSLDQPAEKRDTRHTKRAALHTKFIKPGVAKSLTRFAVAPWPAAPGTTSR